MCSSVIEEVILYLIGSRLQPISREEKIRSFEQKVDWLTTKQSNVLCYHFVCVETKQMNCISIIHLSTNIFAKKLLGSRPSILIVLN